MPKPYPKEFRDDVVRVARNREPGVTIEQIATDFGVHPMTLSKWLRQADVDDGCQARRRPGASRPSCAKRAGGSSCWSRRTRSCAGRRRICRRRTCREKALPARQRARRRRDPRRGDVPGAQARPPALLPLAGRARSPTPSWIEAYRANALFDAHRDDPEFGYRFLVDEARDAGAADGRADRVADLLAATAGGARSARSAARTARRPGRRSHDDLVAARLHRRPRRTSCGWPTSSATRRC